MLSWVTFESGAPATFVVTGGIFDAAGVTCVFPEGWIYQESTEATATDPESGEPLSWSLEAEPYELRDGVLIDLSSGEPNPDPPIAEGPTPPIGGGFTCGTLTL